MNKYEIALVLSSKADEEARNKILERVTKRVEKFGGTVNNIDDQGKKRLAYEIQKMNEGFYYFIDVDCPPEAPASIEKHLRIMDPVIRFLIVKQDA